jgi:hypothetical protein
MPVVSSPSIQLIAAIEQRLLQPKVVEKILKLVEGARCKSCPSVASAASRWRPQPVTVLSVVFFGRTGTLNSPLSTMNVA